MIATLWSLLVDHPDRVCQVLGFVSSIGVIEVVSVRRERLDTIDQADVIREGFPEMTPAEFVAFFCRTHRGCTPETEVTRIEFRRVDAPARVLVADPPWQHKDPGIRCGTKRHYRTLSTSEICTFDLPPLAADCWLWLWCTHNHHADAHQVAAAWGFDRYRSEGVWVKTSASGQPRIGGGHTLRQCHEKFLLFSRGKPERIDKGLPSAIIAPHPRGADKRILHSAKPDEFYELVRRFSQGPRVELFARQHRPGFECFGDELPTPGAA